MIGKIRKILKKGKIDPENDPNLEKRNAIAASLGTRIGSETGGTKKETETSKDQVKYTGE